MATRVHGWFTGMLASWPFSGDAPKGWLFCDGQEVSRRSRLGKLLVEQGCLWGDGDGHKTVNIPDFRGRILMMRSPTHDVGDTGGSEECMLTAQQMPRHTHMVAGPAQSRGLECGDLYAVPMGTVPQKTTSAGGGEPFQILPPYGVVSIVIRL